MWTDHDYTQCKTFSFQIEISMQGVLGTDSFKLNELFISILQGLNVPLQVGGEQHQVHEVPVQVGTVSPSLQLHTDVVQQRGQAGVVLDLVRGKV